MVGKVKSRRKIHIEAQEAPAGLQWEPVREGADQPGC